MDIINDENIIALHNGKTYTADDIETALLTIADNHFMADGANIYKVNQSRWTAVLMDAGKMLFDNNALRDPSNMNNRQYDKALVSKICNVYLYLCNKYGKLVTMAGFGYFANIPYETIKQWTEAENLSDIAIDTKQKINDGTAGAIVNKLYDSNNVTGQIMLANNMLGWNTSRASNETTHRVENISTLADDYKALGMAENET